MNDIVLIPLYERAGQLIGGDGLHTVVDAQRLVEGRRSPDAFSTFTRVTGFPKTLRYRLVIPKRTLSHRLQSNAPLTAAESDRLIRIARITALAERVLGDRDKARRWLTRRKRFLEDNVNDLF